MNSDNKTRAILNVCLVIPTYNHDTFIGSVLSDCVQLSMPIIVINDGSTDQTKTIVEKMISQHSDISFYLINFAHNQGKGAAIKAGARKAMELGYDSIITMDSDGQHYASDIEGFIKQAILTPEAIIIGSRGLVHENMPKKNTTANRISNFWFHVQTLTQLPDTQSGFRYYPLSCFRKMIWFTDRYNFELEIMVRNIWRGYTIKSIPIQVYYPPSDIRVSHFKPTIDFLRITVLNTFLSITAFLYFYPKKVIQYIINKF